jgi:hypothetical protein
MAPIPTAVLGVAPLAFPCSDPQPPILAVQGDIVTVLNAQGAPEKVGMHTFGSAQWEPKNPGNPAVAYANECYRLARLKILTEAGLRPAALFEGCDEEQRRTVAAALQLATGSLNVALEKLDLARAGVAGALAQVERHFKTRADRDIQAISANLKRTKALLDNVTAFDCSESGCGTDRAWTRGVAGTTIHLCKPYFEALAGQSNMQLRTRTTIHEACHLAFGATYGLLGSETYHREALKLSRDQAMNNAASYANFAVGMYNQ